MKRKPTPAVKEAELFIVKAKAIKAARIPEDLRLPDDVEGIEAGRPPGTPTPSALEPLRAIKRNETQTRKEPRR